MEELESKVKAYFDSCHDKNGDLIRPYTITGLALALDTSRETLIDYEEKEGYSDTIKRAKAKIENFAEEQLFTNRNTAGVIFNMVNNWGWKNKQEHEQNINAKVDATVETNLNSLSTEELQQLEQLLSKTT